LTESRATPSLGCGHEERELVDAVNDEIGFIGLGNMGSAMAGLLLDAGFRLRVYNRTRAKAEPLGERGAIIASRPAEAAEPGGIVISMLANDAAVEEIVPGEDGIAARLGEGGIHVSMSTIAPATSRRLAEMHRQTGLLYVAAPVFGRPEAAAAKKLWILSAGPQAARARVRPLLDAMGQGIFEIGEDAAGANVIKLAGNFLIASAMEAMAEAFTLAEKNGIERGRVAELFGRTMFACPIYQIYGRLIANEQFEPAGFAAELGLKDLDLVLKTASESGMPMPLADLVRNRLTATIAKGRRHIDWSGFTLTVAEDAGMR
jgi:3-hydroxyisobutyrate dehydrogenase-like beta-hydroxyacid dehydrogenase